jgi:hypothetical protein
MQAAWRLATSNLSARRSRALLLIAAVTLSAALIAAVACALESANGAIRQQLEGQIGSAELRIRPANAGGVFPIGVMEIAESWPETDFAVPRARDAISVRVPLTVLEPSEDGSGSGSGRAHADDRRDGERGRSRDRVRDPPPHHDRGPAAPERGEIAVDAQAGRAAELGRTRTRTRPEEALNRLGVDTSYLDRPEPEVPES